MDLWIVAAATGAGYFAKYWQNQSKDEDALTQLLSFGDFNLVSSGNSNHLLSKFSRRKKRCEDVFTLGSTEETSFDFNQLDSASSSELVSMSGFENEKLGILGNFLDFKSESSKSGVMGDDFGMLLCNNSSKTDSLHVSGWNRSRSTAKTRFSQGDLIKPLSFYEQTKLEKENHDPNSLLSPPSPTFRPFLVSGESKSVVLEELPFRPLETTHNTVTVNNKAGKRCPRKSGNSSEMVSTEHLGTKGSSDESLLYTGIIIGLISSFISSKKEAHKLKELLKQTESLVLDLHEKLETKDASDIKEIINDNCESSYSFSDVCFEKTSGKSSSKCMDYAMTFEAEELWDQKAKESTESRSKIEAELEAELERLGLNVSTYSLEGFSSTEEIDPDYIEDLAEGEAVNDMFSGKSSTWTTNQNLEGSNSTTYSGNYTVSPMELSLRLHEVIQWKLEARIKELEIALLNNQSKLQFINTEYKNSCLTMNQYSNELLK